jgi:hypothetical protein
VKAKLLQMKTAPPVERFHRTVETLESDVNFDIRSVANENGTCPLCAVDLTNPGPHGGFCRALLTPENVDQLIEALTAWKMQA